MDKITMVRFTWNIVYDCNFRCSYCFFEGKWEEYKKRNVYLSVNEWMGHWNRIRERYGQIFLVVTGGEPFIYPGFFELVEQLSEVCAHINISTNASTDLGKFIDRIDPERVSLSLSFQREFDSLDNYIEKVKLVRKHNFKGCLNVVAYPPFLEELENDKERLLKEAGEEFKIIPFFGEYKDIAYPEGYGQKERELVGIDEAWFRNITRSGELCFAGHTSALIFPDGKAARCGQIGERFVLGNFFDPEFQLYDKPMICDAEYCPCREDSIEGDG